MTTYVQRDRSIEDLAHHARFLAKRGVNMVRLHGHMDPKDKNARLTDVDDKAIDEAWKLVAAMKKEGIYVTISPYWSANIKHVPSQWGLEGWPENEGAVWSAVLQSEASGRLQGLAQSAAHPAQSVYGHSAGEGSRAGDHPASE